MRLLLYQYRPQSSRAATIVRSADRPGPQRVGGKTAMEDSLTPLVSHALRTRSVRGPVLWKISVAVPAEAEEAVSDLLEGVFKTPPVAWHDTQTGRTVISAYIDSPRDWSAQARKQIEGGLERVWQCGLTPKRIRIQATRLRHEDWANSWKRHFRAMEFGRALLVKPSWIRRQPRHGQQVVVLDPGLSFGTGQHPTTGFCLEQIVEGRKPGTAQSLLDIGTGSGILAIAAVKLGYRPVEAYDFDADAVRIARANARQNGVARPLRIARRDLTREPIRSVQKFDMVCANLILDLLLSERIRIVNRVCPGGALVVAGILREQFPAVARAYGRLGFRLRDSRREKEWQSGVFTRT